MNIYGSFLFMRLSGDRGMVCVKRLKGLVGTGYSFKSARQRGASHATLTFNPAAMTLVSSFAHAATVGLQCFILVTYKQHLAQL